MVPTKNFDAICIKLPQRNPSNIWECQLNWLNLVNVKVSRNEDGTNLKYFEIKLQDIG